MQCIVDNGKRCGYAVCKLVTAPYGKIGALILQCNGENLSAETVRRGSADQKISSALSIIQTQRIGCGAAAEDPRRRGRDDRSIQKCPDIELQRDISVTGDIAVNPGAAGDRQIAGTRSKIDVSRNQSAGTHRHTAFAVNRILPGGQLKEFIFIGVEIAQFFRQGSRCRGTVRFSGKDRAADFDVQGGAIEPVSIVLCGCNDGSAEMPAQCPAGINTVCRGGRRIACNGADDALYFFRDRQILFRLKSVDRCKTGDARQIE